MSTKYAAEEHARGDPHGEALVVWSAFAVTVALSTGVGLGVVVFGPTIVTLLHVPPSLQGEAATALRVLTVAVVGLAAANSLNTPQQVRLEWRSLTLATSGPAVVQILAAPVLLAVIGGGLIVMAATAAASATLAAILNFRISARMQPALRVPRLGPRTVRLLLRSGLPLAAFGFAAIAVDGGERFVLAHFRSPSAVSYYAVAYSLSSLFTVIPAAVAQPLLPVLSRLNSQGRLTELGAVYRQALIAVFLVSSPLLLLLAFVAHAFLALWAGVTYGSHSTVPFYLMLGGLWLNTLAYIPFNQLVASGETSLIATVQVVEVVPYLALTGFLTYQFGIVGAAIGWSLRCALDSLAFFTLVRFRYKLPWNPNPTNAGANASLLVIIGATMLALSQVTSSLPARTSWGCLLLLGYAYGAWRVVLTDSERRGIAETILPLWRHLPGPRRR